MKKVLSQYYSMIDCDSDSFIYKIEQNRSGRIITVHHRTLKHTQDFKETDLLGSILLENNKIERPSMRPQWVLQANSLRVTRMYY